MQPTQYAFNRSAVVVLHKIDGAADGGFKLGVVEAFKEKAAFVTEYGRFDDFYVWDFGVDDVHIVFLYLID